MKKTIIIMGILTILVLILLTGCKKQQITEEKKNYTLDKVIEQFNKIDKKYNANWKIEQIPDNLVFFVVIEPMIKELKLLKQQISMQKSNETDALISLINGRIAMLKAQKYFYTALHLIEISSPDAIERFMTGKLSINEFVNCYDDKELKTRLKFAKHLTELVKNFNMFFKEFDKSLQYYATKRDVESIIKIGIDKNKIGFYIIKGESIMNQAIVNEEAVRQICQKDF